MRFSLFLILSLLLPGQLVTAESGDLHVRKRLEWNTTDLDSSANNIPTSPSTAAGSKLATILAGTGVAGTVGHSDHAVFCSEATTRIRVRFSDTTSSAPASSAAYNFTVPASASGSFVCISLDDVQLGQYIYIWSAGSAITSGLFYSYGW